MPSEEPVLGRMVSLEQRESELRTDVLLLTVSEQELVPLTVSE